jgi:hypothetical protein
MPDSPFPGMDPYLEAPELWPDAHDRLSNIVAELLAPQIAPKYVAELNTRIVIERAWDEVDWARAVVPDITLQQRLPAQHHALDADTAVAIAPAPLRLHLPIGTPMRQVTVYLRRQSDKRLVGVIEMLSPANKRPGKDREDYLDKRSHYLDTGVHLIEIDLLRQWPRLPFVEVAPACDYLIMVSPADRRPECDVWALSVRQPLPLIPVPLLRSDSPAMLDLGLALRTAYVRARYDLRINYQQPPLPPLRGEDAAWARQQIQQAK